LKKLIPIVVVRFEGGEKFMEGRKHKGGTTKFNFSRKGKKGDHRSSTQGGGGEKMSGS